MRTAFGRYRRLYLATRFAMMVAFVVMCGSITAHGVTAEQARDLPAQELAKQVLGDAGRLFVEVRRPGWQDGAVIFANRPIEGEAPPLRWLDFFGRPYLAGFGGVEGLCEAQRLRVDFSKAGDVAGLQLSKVDGFAQPVSFGNPFPNVQRAKELDQRCKSVSAQHFFGVENAPGDVGAAIDAVNQVHEAMVRGGAPWLTLTCFSYLNVPQRCSAAAYAEHTTIDSIKGLGGCLASQKLGDLSHPKDRCWKVGLGGMPCTTQQELTIVLDGESDHVAIRSAAFRDDRIVC